jgi:hypothetical protein
VEPKAFRRLTNLVELDLSENVMREVPTEAWKNAKALMRLNLSGNPIKLIRSGAFQKLQVQCPLFRVPDEWVTIYYNCTSLFAVFDSSGPRCPLVATF